MLKNKFKKYLKIVEYLIYDIEQNIRNPVTEYIRRNPAWMSELKQLLQDK